MVVDVYGIMFPVETVTGSIPPQLPSILVFIYSSTRKREKISDLLA